MNREEIDNSYLWDIYDAAKDINEFVKNRNFEEFKSSKILRFAVERQLLVIGEAAKHISNNFKKKHPEISWNSMIGLRNIIAHEYGEILVERIWRVAKKDIPTLFKQIKKLVPET